MAIEGNVFMFGHTAGLAWELPSTPIFLNKKHLEQIKKEEEEKRKSAKPKQKHTPEHGNFLKSLLKLLKHFSV